MLAGPWTTGCSYSLVLVPASPIPFFTFFDSRRGTGPAVKGAPAEDAGRMVVVYDHGRALAELIVTYKVALRRPRQSLCE